MTNKQTHRNEPPQEGELTGEKFEERKKTSGWFTGQLVWETSFTDFQFYKRRRQEIEEKYCGPGLIDCLTGGLESAKNLTQLGFKDPVIRVLDRVLGGLLLGAYTLSLSSSLQKGNFVQSLSAGGISNTLGFYILSEGVAMFSTGRVFPVSLQIVDYATRAVSGLANLVSRKKQEEIK